MKKDFSELINNSNPWVWADAFCQNFAGKTVVGDSLSELGRVFDPESYVDPEAVVGWFINFAEACRLRSE